MEGTFSGLIWNNSRAFVNAPLKMITTNLSHAFVSKLKFKMNSPD
jgi:hypothetical protein